MPSRTPNLAPCSAGRKYLECGRLLQPNRNARLARPAPRREFRDRLVEPCTIDGVMVDLAGGASMLLAELLDLDGGGR
jgi:hypothetical protein